VDIKEIAQKYAAAWSSGNPDAVASFYSADGVIVINRGDPISGRIAVSEMASGFYSEFPDLVVSLDHMRVAGDHVMFGWILEGTHSETGNKVRVSGWEEWDLDSDLKVKSSRGWFDSQEYDRQVAEGL
jgi:uncharacterized protein (TIGR02246 family)